MKKLIAFLGLFVALVAMLATGNYGNPSLKKTYVHTQNLQEKNTTIETVTTPAPAPEVMIVASREKESGGVENPQDNELEDSLQIAQERISSLEKEREILMSEIAKLREKSLTTHPAWNELSDPDGEIDLADLQSAGVRLFAGLDTDPRDLSVSQVNDIVVRFARLLRGEELARKIVDESPDEHDAIAKALRQEREAYEGFKTFMASRFGNQVADNWKY